MVGTCRSHLIQPPNVPRVQPALIINGLLGLLITVQVAHEHMTTIETDLKEEKCTLLKIYLEAALLISNLDFMCVSTVCAMRVVCTHVQCESLKYCVRARVQYLHIHCECYACTCSSTRMCMFEYSSGTHVRLICAFKLLMSGTVHVILHQS